MTLLDNCTSDVTTEKIVRPYLDLVSVLSAAGMCLASLCNALAQRWNGRDIVLVVDEIILVESDHFFSRLDNTSGTNSIRLIVILNPRFSTTVDLPINQYCGCDESRTRKSSDFPQQSASSVFQNLTQQGFLQVSLQTSYRINNITC